ncbi:MAG: hypothetical protein ACXVPD_05035 [Bacteroidia bacterium]
MKERFIITVTSNKPDEYTTAQYFVTYLEKKAPVMDTYPEAMDWIKTNGIKDKYYQIQKIIQA